MKNIPIPIRFRRLLRWWTAGVVAGVSLGARLLAADAPTDAAAPAPAPGAPAAGSSGTSSVFAPPKEGEVVAIVLRLKLLNVAKTFVQRDNPDLLARLTTADDPFYAKLPPPPAPEMAPGTTAAGNSATSAPPKLTDEDKLAQVAAAVIPTGVIETSNIRLVTFAKRDPVQVGQSFAVQFPNETAPSVIQVVDANDSSCVLKLGDTTLSADFVDNPSAAAGPRPAAPATSQTNKLP
jgi:hypothetical protein